MYIFFLGLYPCFTGLLVHILAFIIKRKKSAEFRIPVIDVHATKADHVFYTFSNINIKPHIYTVNSILFDNFAPPFPGSLPRGLPRVPEASILAML